LGFYLNESIAQSVFFDYSLFVLLFFNSIAGCGKLNTYIALSLCTGAVPLLVFFSHGYWLVLWTLLLLLEILDRMATLFYYFCSAKKTCSAQLFCCVKG